MDNLLMIGPKVIYFHEKDHKSIWFWCFIYIFLYHIKMLFFYLLPRLIIPTQVVCRWVRKAECVSADISLLGTGGTARTARCNFPLTKASEVVIYSHKCEVFLSLKMSNKNKNYTLILSICLATRETSFVHAVSAAGVMHTLTRNCSLGDLDDCGCDSSRNGKLGKNITRLYLHAKLIWNRKYYTRWLCINNAIKVKFLQFNTVVTCLSNGLNC